MKYLFPSILLILTFSGQAQNGFFSKTGKWGIGIKAGGITAKIGDLKTTIIREWHPDSTYMLEEKYNWGFTGGVAFYYRFPNSAVAIQPEVTFSMQGSQLHYTDSILISDTDTVGLDYTMKFKYQYINILPLFKIYPFLNQDNFLNQLHVLIGPQLSINIAPANITYVSNKPYIGPDLQIQQNLRGVLKGRTDVSVALGLGYQLPGEYPFSLECRANLGFVDTVQTLANGYNFIENRNPSVSFQLTLGYTVPVDDPN